MDVDSDSVASVSNVDDWLACFSSPATSKPGAFPFTPHKIRSIESRRARMSDLLIFDVLLIRGGIRSPDMLFPPTDWTALRKLLDAIDGTIYDILKKDCLVYILLKWVWDMDTKETNPGWEARYSQDRCVAPQFAALADAYWLLDTGTHLARAVSILSDARLNRDYVSKVLQALALSSSPASFASGTAPATASLIVKYVRTAKPLLTEPDDIDLYALSLAQLSFMDAWAYQKSFPEASDTRERLLKKMVGWCLMPKPKQGPLAQLLALPLSSYEQSSLQLLALPPQSSSTSPLSSVNLDTATAPSGLTLSSQAIYILQDLLCVRAIQSGDYVGAIKLDRQFASASPARSSGASTSNMDSQIASGRDTIDRRSIIQDIFATLPPAERTLLEEEIGKVATGVRANTLSTPRQGVSTTRRPLRPETSLSASWEDVGASFGSPAPSTSRSTSAVGASFPAKPTPTPVPTMSKINQPAFTPTSASPFISRARPQLVSLHQAPMPKFTAFGSPIPPSIGVGTGRGVISERGKTLFSASAASGPSPAAKPATHVSLFETTGSAKNAPNAFYKPPSAKVGASLDVASALGSSSAAKSAAPETSNAQQNGKAHGGESEDEDMSMGSDVAIVEEDHRDKTRQEEPDEENATDGDDAANFITYDKSGAADLTLRRRDVDEVMDNEEAGPDLGFSVFSGGRSVAQNGRASGHGKRSVSGNGHVPYASPPPRTRVSPSRDVEESLGRSVNSTTSRWRAPPGAFHQDEEDEEENRYNEQEDKSEDEDDGQSLTTPVQSPHRSTRTRMQAQTPSRPSGRSQPQRSSKSVSRPRLSRPIPGALTDEDNDEHDTDYADARDDEGGETDEQEEEDVIAPLPARTSRRTRSSGLIDPSTTPSTKSKSSAKPTASSKASTAVTAGTAGGAKAKAKAQPSEVKTPARRSSRLSTASQSPDHTEAASPTKKGRKTSGPRTSTAGSGSGTVAMRSSTRRKR